jgi:hypothetical protein
MAKAAGISQGSVHRIWKANDLKPHVTKGFKLSNDPHFEEKFWMSLACTSIHQRMLWFCVATKRANARLWNEASLDCPSTMAMRRHGRMITSGMERLHFSQLWIIWMARSSAEPKSITHMWNGSGF